ncbi:hypothetical protein ABK040_001744 [Willaertia magna]
MLNKLFKRTKYTIENKNNEQVSDENYQPSELVYLIDNNQSEITLSGSRCTKVILENNNNTTVKINSSITTGFIEIINCKDCTVVLPILRAKLLQIENVQNCNVKLLCSSLKELREVLHQVNFVTNLTTKNVQISILNAELLEEKLVEIQPNIIEPPSEELNNETDDANTQFKTKIKYISDLNICQLEIKKAIREGGGYLSTVDEKDFHDQLQKEFEQKLEKYLMEKVLKGEEDQEKKKLRQEEIKKKHELIKEKLKAKSQQDDNNSGNFLDQIKGFNKDKLSHQETKETKLMDVVGLDQLLPPSTVDNNNNSRTGVPSDVTEFFDEESVVIAKAKELAEKIKKAKHVVIYTGAGVSTSARIPDYRGPKGVWTLKESGRSSEIKPIKLEQAMPTFAHYCISHLVKKGYVSYVVSTNVDGLHRRSGLDADHLAELHGNSYREVCMKCGKEYLRGFDVCKTVVNYMDHITGRVCECGGKLRDTIVHFSESLPEKELSDSIHHSGNGDLAIVLGTSLRVQPACLLPEMVINNGGEMCIVNLQKTPFDYKCKLRCHAKTDEFMKYVMEALGELDSIDCSYDELSKWEI